MTIAVTSLALTGNAGKTTGTPVAAALSDNPLTASGAGGASIVAGDFAALLTGQKAKPLNADALALLSDAATDKDPQSAAGTSDTNWVLAALGISPPAEAIARAAVPVAGHAAPDAPGDGSTVEGLGTRRSAAGILAGTADSSAQENTETLNGRALFLSTPDANPAANDSTVVAGAANLAALASSKETLRPTQGEAIPPSLANSGIAEANGTSRPAAALTTGALPSVAAPLRDAAWPGEFAQKIVWMSRNDVQNAQITLNPPQLGPIEISLNIRNEQATAAFVSANPEVREAIESALPRLREMLAGAGVELGQANVSAESFRHADGRQTASENGRGIAAREALGLGENSTIPATTERSGNGLVDTFA